MCIRDRYVDDSVELSVPAKLDPAQHEKLRELAVQAFLAMDGEGLARVDMFVTGNDVVINEINTMPGFTPISMYPRMWAETGLDYPALVDALVQDASGDKLDAVLCMVQAALAQQRHVAGDKLYGLPPKMDALEGWIIGV